MEDNDYDLILKIVIAGDTSVGKSNLILRYCKDFFVQDSKATIGIDFFMKDILIQDRSVKVQFWDTAGQEKYNSISHTYFKMVSGVLLVYDISRIETYEKAKNMLSLVKKYCPDEVKVMLIGNKMDLVENRMVLTEDAKKFASEHGLFFWETSALTNQDKCVFKAFDALLKECMNAVKNNETKQNLLEIKKKYLNIETRNEDEKRGRFCCSSN